MNDYEKLQREQAAVSDVLPAQKPEVAMMREKENELRLLQQQLEIERHHIEEEKKKIEDKNKKIWKMSEAALKESHRLDEANQLLEAEKVKLESDKKKLDEKIKKLWQASLIVHKEKERISELNELLAQRTDELVQKNIIVEQQKDELIEKNIVVEQQKNELVQKNKDISNLVTDREKTIEIRTAELQIAIAKLVELIQYNAHNIREPLTRIMGVMNLREYVSDTEYIEIYLPMMEKSVNDLDNTIKHVILDLEQTTENKK